MNIIRKRKPRFLDIDARLFQNKSNGQLSISLPKKQLKEIIDVDNIPESQGNRIPIRVFKWRSK